MRSIIAAAATAIAFAAPASAATLTVFGGQLTGATGVVIGTGIYDVGFVEGTCIDLFTGCDTTSDFDFVTDLTADLAAQALLDQVFIGGFDDDPELIAGCESTAVCRVLIPYAFPTDTQVTTARSVNFNVEPNDTIDTANIARTTNTAGAVSPGPGLVYADFTLVGTVPLPAAGWGLIAGLGGLAALRRKRRNA